MKKPDIASNEKERLATLRALDILDTDPEERYDRLTRLAQRLLDVPIAMISLVDSDRQWFKSKQGIDVNGTARDISFCGHAINEDNIFVVSDTFRDERFFDNPLVRGEPKIRFYAAYPLAAQNGMRVGTFCIIDRKPKYLSGAETKFLENLGHLAELELSERGGVEDQLFGGSSTKYFKSVLKYLSDFSKDMSFPLSVLKLRVDQIDREKNSKDISQDRFLFEVAKVVGNYTRKSDFVGKLDDDLFYVVAPKCTKANLGLISNRLERNFGQLQDDKKLPSSIKLNFKYLEYDYTLESVEQLVVSSDPF